MAGDASFKNISTKTAGGGYWIAPDELDALILPPNWSRWDGGEDAELDELTESIAREGQKQPAVITKDAEGNAVLVAGSRRRAAVKRINADPAKWGKPGPVSLLVRYERMSPDEAVVANLEENLRRKSLSPVDLASYARELLRLGWDEEKVAHSMRASPAKVRRLMELWRHERDTLDLIHEGKMPESLAHKLLGLSPSKVRRVVERIKAGDSTKEVTAEVVEARRESGKRVGRTLAELKALIAPLVEDGAWLPVALSEYLAGALDEEAMEKAFRDASETEVTTRPKRAAGGAA
jgi:ParB/RepB/Spo0J family partition protein